MIHLNNIPRRSKKLAWRIIEGEAVVLPLDNPAGEERLNKFNATATRIWELCDGKRTVKDIISQLKDEYLVDYEKVRSETEKIILELFKKNLITI